MPLDDNLLDAIADTIAETEKGFGNRIDALRKEMQQMALTEIRIAGDDIEQELTGRLDELTANLDAAEQRLRDAALERLREERLDLDKQLFATRKHYDQLCADLRERLATLKDGEPGAAGEPGLPGDKGEKGDPGEPAPDPTEDMVAAALEKLREDRLEIDEKLFAAAKRFDRLSGEFEERLATLKDGEPGPAGPEGAPGRDGIDGRTGDARGLYAAAETYRKMDRVSLNGSEWIARKDDPGPLPGDGWMLGAQGKTGKPGASIQRITTKDYAMVVEMSDGKQLAIDMRGMFERYDEERAG